ncbi:MAG: hypothetical protein J6I64_02450 [Lachnospiraceae bacterium]|nr:hypothetical protein [Lachnospiraceae bacterium]
MTMYEKYQAMNLDRSLLCLEQCDYQPDYFCYPEGAQPIGYEGSIMYCFLEDYGEMVFAVNPETCADIYVYPLARDFRHFLRLILACGTANPIEQIVWMTKERFEQHVSDEAAIRTPELTQMLERIAEELGLEAMDEPYEYVKALQQEFDGSRIRYTDEYYDHLASDADLCAKASIKTISLCL